MKHKPLKHLASITLLGFLVCSGCPTGERIETSLNGTWQLAKTAHTEGMPATFNATVPVPGLVDLATPALDEKNALFNDASYWYKRTFQTEDAPVIRLKINKAKYQTQVYLNGQLAGENAYSYTPTELDIKPFLKPAGEANELIIRVGSQNNLPDSINSGKDWEKLRYIPGIYDDVKLITAGYPYLNNIQIAPDPAEAQIRVRVELLTRDNTLPHGAQYAVNELVSGKTVTTGSFDAVLREGDFAIADFTVPMEDFTYWSPENPFLYTLTLTTDGDTKTTRFGMRTFKTNNANSSVLLNGKTYFMRGTNVCIGRFSEDSERGTLPWDNAWVTGLHKNFKEMHWNSCRYCIGFPPERWYEIADSLGILIQDEYPIWMGWAGMFERQMPNLTPERLACEYRAWMRERWNHPSVVIWDANNETVTKVTGAAIDLVRELDLSDRPWENSWSTPSDPDKDMTEAHPYIFCKYQLDHKAMPSKHGALYDEMNESVFHRPDSSYHPAVCPNFALPAPDYKVLPNPIINNEYTWIWINRDGSPTALTKRLYRDLYPEVDTPEKRRVLFAKLFAQITEFWRSTRRYAGLMHFCAVGYSRPNPPLGATSDNFIDVAGLQFEPSFEKYAKWAFNPVGLMVGFWDARPTAGAYTQAPLTMINDTYNVQEGNVRIIITNNKEQEVFAQSMPYLLNPLEKQKYDFAFTIPADKGTYRLEASFDYEGEKVTSEREFIVE